MVVNNTASSFRFSSLELGASDADLLKRFQHFFMNFSTRRTTTYKYALMKSILDNLLNVEFRADMMNRVKFNFNSLAYKFAESYWNIVAVYKLNQGSLGVGETTAIHKGINKVLENLNIENDVPPWDNLPDSQKWWLTDFVKKKCFCNRDTYVFGALCGEFEGFLYEFDKKEEYFALSLNAYKFMQKHKVFIENNNYYCWARYLEDKNLDENTESILTKLINSVPQRTNLVFYQKFFENVYKYDTCFYCGKKIHSSEKREYQIDHFIPWSFVKEDKVWNFVPSCPECNGKKTNFLPPSNMISRIEERNDYIKETLLKKCNNENTIIQINKDFHSYRERTVDHKSIIEGLYEYAQDSGYSINDRL